MIRKEEKESCIWMNFSGIYHLQTFCRKNEMYQLDVSDLTGTNCYCDDLAIEELRKRMEPFSYRGIHFLDSGNYHYMSRIWMEKIQEPFRLLVFDNHTDLQPPAFGGILSCGGWVAASLEDLPYLEEVVLIGPDESAFDAVEERMKSRVRFFSRESLKTDNLEKLISWIKELPFDLPFYFSIDKDILAEQVMKTNWSQGDLTEEELLEMLEYFRKQIREHGTEILGMDVCGEAETAHPETIEESDQINLRLLNFWQKK